MKLNYSLNYIQLINWNELIEFGLNWPIVTLWEVIGRESGSATCGHPLVAEPHWTRVTDPGVAFHCSFVRIFALGAKQQQP